MTPEDTRREVVKAFFDILEEKGDVTDVTISDIAGVAGVNRSTVYRSFGDLYGIARAFLEDISAQYLQRWTEGDDRSERAYLMSMFTQFYGYRREMLLLYRNNLLSPLLDVLMNRFGIHRSHGVQRVYHLAYHAGGVYGIIMHWMEGGMNETPEEMITYAVGILIVTRSPVTL